MTSNKTSSDVAGGPGAQSPDASRPATAQPQGLSSADAQQKLAEVGPNELTREEGISPWKVLAGQFKGAMLWLLIGAGVISLALGEVADAVAIGAIVVLNTLIGFFQEYRAERSVQALRSMTAPRARVLRDGASKMIPAAEVVPGDVLVLEAGDIVAADARLLDANSLRMKEASLTGESTPVEKRVEPGGVPLAPETPLAERTDSIFLGTSVAAGTATAEVFGTGMKTELGKIAHLLAQTKSETTPLQQRLEQVGRLLLVLCLALVAVVATLGLLRGQGWLEVLMTSVSLAVAAVPEGLAAIVTIALALGVQSMVSRNVLIRKLPAVETLGCATVICTDKTGTLTTGIMVVRELWGPDHNKLLDAATACCDAELTRGETTGTGDPTEVAILMAAYEREIDRAVIERERPRVAVEPFDSSTKRMTVLRSDGILYVKGAVEVVLPRCTRGTEGAMESNATMAGLGLRVLAVAVGQGPKEENLHLLGLIGIADPPRTEAIDAIAKAHMAGIRTMMITGDHPITARAIAVELGLLRPGDDPLVWVHARATAEDKLKIVRDLKAEGHIVAMTGDGVNDAPALKEAHIGIAMGKTGTEVTREASDMILTDDNYASIVTAIQEGRGIYDNIRKALVFLLTGNVGEIGVMLGASLVGLPMPLLPLQLLWINLVTDGLPALALVADPATDEVLQRPPRRTDEPILGQPQWVDILLVGGLEAILALMGFFWVHGMYGLDAAREFAFSILVYAQLARSFAARSTKRVYFEVGILSNLWLVGVVVLSVALQLGLRAIPLTRELFHLGALPMMEYLATVLLGLVPVTMLEVSKLVRRAVGKEK